MDVNNLTSVYNQNPTLQGQYTLPEYLALFGGSSTPTTPTTPTPDPTTPTLAPSQGIINANINQYQGGDNDGYTGFGDFGNLKENTAKTEYKDVSDGKGGSYVQEFTTYEDSGGLRKTIDGKNISHGDTNTIYGMLLDGITGNKKTNEEGYKKKGGTYGTFSKRPDLTVGGIPYADLSLFGKIKVKFDRDRELKDLGKLAIEKQQLKEQLAKEEAAAQIERAKKRQAPSDPGSRGRDDTPGFGRTTAGNFTNQFQGGDPGLMAKGGRVGYNDGGSTNGSGEKAFSGKVKELMDDGYEFGEAVKEAMKQGYANGGRVNYFKGGIVSLRRR